MAGCERAPSPTLSADRRHSERLRLPLVLPHWIADEPTPFIYLVDRYRELEENELWFVNRRRVVNDELIVDLTGAALRTSEQLSTK